MAFQTLAELVLSRVRTFSERPCLEDATQRLSFHEVYCRAVACSEVLAREGAVPGERVIVVDTKPLDTALWVLGCVLGGCVFAVVDGRTQNPQMTRLLQDAEPRVVVDNGDARAVSLRAARSSWIAEEIGASMPAATGQLRVEAGSPAIGTDLACLIYTSGSTGHPKGIMCPNRSMLAAIQAIQSFLKNDECDKIGCALPLSFDYGLYQVFLAIEGGSSVVFLPRPATPPEMLEALSCHGITAFPAIRSLLVPLMRLDSKDAPSLRYVSNTGDYLPENLIRQTIEFFHGPALFSMYGLSECKRALYLEPDRLLSKPKSVGRAIPGTRAFVVDPEGNPAPPGTVGELVIEGPHVMDGYWRDPEETAQRFVPAVRGGLRLHTGDLFTTDADGDLYFVARNRDIIKSGGVRVSPKAVEMAIMEAAPFVIECVVYGMPDELLGEAIFADVVLTDSTYDVADVVIACRDALDSTAVPQRINVVAQLTRTANGKYVRPRRASPAT